MKEDRRQGTERIDEVDETDEIDGAVHDGVESVNFDGIEGYMMMDRGTTAAENSDGEEDGDYDNSSVVSVSTVASSSVGMGTGSGKGMGLVMGIGIGARTGMRAGGVKIGNAITNTGAASSNGVDNDTLWSQLAVVFGGQHINGIDFSSSSRVRIEAFRCSFLRDSGTLYATPTYLFFVPSQHQANPSITTTHSIANTNVNASVNILSSASSSSTSTLLPTVGITDESSDSVSDHDSANTKLKPPTQSGLARALSSTRQKLASKRLSMSVSRQPQKSPSQEEKETALEIHTDLKGELDNNVEDGGGDDSILRSTSTSTLVSPTAATVRKPNSIPNPKTSPLASYPPFYITVASITSISRVKTMPILLSPNAISIESRNTNEQILSHFSKHVFHAFIGVKVSHVEHAISMLVDQNRAVHVDIVRSIASAAVSVGTIAAISADASLTADATLAVPVSRRGSFFEAAFSKVGRTSGNSRGESRLDNQGRNANGSRAVSPEEINGVGIANEKGPVSGGLLIGALKAAAAAAPAATASTTTNNASVATSSASIYNGTTSITAFKAGDDNVSPVNISKIPNVLITDTDSVENEHSGQVTVTNSYIANSGNSIGLSSNNSNNNYNASVPPLPVPQKQRTIATERGRHQVTDVSSAIEILKRERSSSAMRARARDLAAADSSPTSTTSTGASSATFEPISSKQQHQQILSIASPNFEKQHNPHQKQSDDTLSFMSNTTSMWVSDIFGGIFGGGGALAAIMDIDITYVNIYGTRFQVNYRRLMDFMLVAFVGVVVGVVVVDFWLIGVLVWG
ncbi:hypothetical protein HK100_007033 [Physocladia obscura]|uniref:Uncharacterized protein n=1 Tax=Physocladia obscura TaxID=109957 RepID=A0AAD5T558_9FUNG|nr:hypothetical protein HK100_007033 [Physocladia obscura]